MVTTLYLIRHGETIGSETRRYKGSIDVPMSEEGLAQIRKVSAFIAAKLQLSEMSMRKSYLNAVHTAFSQNSGHGETKLSAVYCSDLNRAVKSAEIIAEPHGLKPLVMPEFRERNFGVWEGMTFDEIKQQYPSEFDAWASNPLKHSPVNGESTMDVYERVIRALDAVISKHAAERKNTATHIVIAAHGGVNRIILCHLMGVPLENVFRIEQDPAAINIIEFWERYPVIKLLNGGPLG
ncbi:MAG: histidine phosphatase family protein [Dissulfurispiraceae bacterium]|jgi:broad specificity phosphatase PhoE